MEEFVETQRDRPAYDKDEIEEWIDSWQITSTDPFQTVIAELAKNTGEPPTTGELSHSINSIDDSKLKTVLDILERQGVVELLIENDGRRGRPSKQWKLT